MLHIYTSFDKTFIGIFNCNVFSVVAVVAVVVVVVVVVGVVAVVVVVVVVCCWLFVGCCLFGCSCFFVDLLVLVFVVGCVC